MVGSGALVNVVLVDVGGGWLEAYVWDFTYGDDVTYEPRHGPRQRPVSAPEAMRGP